MAHKKYPSDFINERDTGGRPGAIQTAILLRHQAVPVGVQPPDRGLRRWVRHRAAHARL